VPGLPHRTRRLALDALAELVSAVAGDPQPGGIVTALAADLPGSTVAVAIAPLAAGAALAHVGEPVPGDHRAAAPEALVDLPEDTVAAHRLAVADDDQQPLGPRHRHVDAVVDLEEADHASGVAAD